MTSEAYFQKPWDECMKSFVTAGPQSRNVRTHSGPVWSRLEDKYFWLMANTLYWFPTSARVWLLWNGFLKGNRFKSLSLLLCPKNHQWDQSQEKLWVTHHRIAKKIYSIRVPLWNITVTSETTLTTLFCGKKEIMVLVCFELIDALCWSIKRKSVYPAEEATENWLSLRCPSRKNILLGIPPGSSFI